MSTFITRIEKFHYLIEKVTVLQDRYKPKSAYEYTCTLSNWNTSDCIFVSNLKYKKLTSLFNREFPKCELDGIKLSQYLSGGHNEEYINRYLANVKLKYF